MGYSVILSGCRTPIGSFQGGLSSLTGPQLGAAAIKEAILRAGIAPETVDEAILGCVLQGGLGQAPGRQAALWGGLSPEVAVTTVNKVCGSGLEAIMQADRALRCGDATVVVAGGFESMSRAPYISENLRTGAKFGHATIKDLMIHDGLWCPFKDWHMGNAAEHTARKWNVSREDQDAYACESQRKAGAAMAEGRFTAEIVPVTIPQRKGDPLVVSKDEPPRPTTSMESLSKLSPAFEKGGTVTAGNAPGLTDGAAAVVVTSEEYAAAHGLKPIARILAHATGGTPPEDLFYAPVVAVRKLMAKMGVDINWFDLIEANEAFAVQCLVDGRELGWDPAKVNVNGGAIALGHPIGASGTRIVVTLIHALQARGLKRGLATLCLGGGNAVALALEVL